MASRRLFGDILPTHCECGNICNRTTARRGNCPCLLNDGYCSPSCKCGTKYQECINQPGKGGPLDMQLGLPAPEEEEEEEEEEGDTDPDWHNGTYEDGHDLCKDVQDLNESLRSAAEDQYPLLADDKQAEDDTDAIMTEAQKEAPQDPFYNLSDASRHELIAIIKRMVNHAPDMERFLRPKGRPASGETAGEPEPSPQANQEPQGHAPGEEMEEGGAPEPNPGPEPAEAPSWCKCNKCVEMPTRREQRCCRSRRGPCITITAAEDLNAAVLDRRMLVVCIRDRNLLYLLNDDPYSNECLRHMAYRRYILWEYGRLGAGNRRVIPSCSVWAIRRKYPAVDNVYVGYIPSRLN